MQHLFDMHLADFTPKPAREPTSAVCGSAEKVEVLRRRVERGEHLYHPQDSTEQARPAMSGEYQAGIRECAVGVR